jgi:hypothetical protein
MRPPLDNSIVGVAVSFRAGLGRHSGILIDESGGDPLVLTNPGGSLHRRRRSLQKPNPPVTGRRPVHCSYAGQMQ